MANQSLTSAEDYVGTLSKSIRKSNNVRVRFREVPQVKEQSYTRVGYLPESTGVPEEYITTVTSRALQCKVCSVVQEQIRFVVNGVWEPFPGLGMFNELVDLVPQAILGVTIVQPWMKRRMWRGATPIQIITDMKFVAYDSAYNNVVMPCMLLQQMALPQEAFSLDYVENEGMKNEVNTNILSVYSPPGPSPFTVFEDWNRNGDKIDITFGSFLKFENVIITECDIVMDNKFSSADSFAYGVTGKSNGLPISGTARVIFETYEMMTKETLKAVYGFNSGAGTTQSLTLDQAAAKIKGVAIDKIRDIFQ
jgi:hypothetical protein